MSRIVLRVVLAACLVMAALPSPSPAAPAEGDLAPLSLALEDAVARAIENNLDVQVARTGPRQSELNVVLGEAAFAPTVSAGATHSESTTEPTSSFSAESSETDVYDLSVSGRMATGFSYSAALDHVDSTTNFPAFAIQRFNFIPDVFTSGVSTTLRHPLLKGLGREVNRAEIVVARRDLEVSESQFHQQLLDTVRDVENAYWDLVTAQKNLEVQQKSLKRAHDLYTLNKTKVEVGTLAPIEITTAEAEVAQREQDVIVAEQAIVDAEDALKALMNLPLDSPDWHRRIAVLDQPEFQPGPVDLESAIARAREHRTDLREARLALGSRQIEAAVARNGVRPALDAVATYRSEGNSFDREILDPPRDIDGDGVPDDTLDIVQDRSESFAEIADRPNEDWSVGLEFAYPIGNRAAQADYSRAVIAVNQAELQVLQAEQGVVLDVRRAARSLETDAKRVEAARANVRLQEKKVDAEQKKYENGMSTSFEVLTFQNDLAAAESGLISATSDWTKARTALAHATGTLLEERGLRTELAAGPAR